MFDIFLFIHSWIRWLILVLLVFVFYRSFIGFIYKKPYEKIDKIFGGILLGAVHLQLLVGFILYFALSAITHVALSNMALAVKSSIFRYWSIEHILGMVIFAFFVQLGRTLSKKAKYDQEKQKRTFICLVIAIFILIAMMPWPFRKYIGRPLFLAFPTTQSVA